MTNKHCRRRCLYKDSCGDGYSCEGCSYFTPTNSDREIFNLMREKEQEHFNDWTLYIDYAETGCCQIDDRYDEIVEIVDEIII